MRAEGCSAKINTRENFIIFRFFLPLAKINHVSMDLKTTVSPEKKEIENGIRKNPYKFI